MGYMAGYNRPALSLDQIRESVTGDLIGTPPLRELAQGKKEAVIIFDDMTRVTRVAEIVPFVLEELAAAGIPDSNIRFVAALGCHGAMNRIDFVEARRGNAGPLPGLQPQPLRQLHVRRHDQDLWHQGLC